MMRQTTNALPPRPRAGLRLAGAAALVLGLLSAVGAGAATEGPGASAWQETEQTALRLVSATATGGGAERLRLGLHFTMKPGWKVYWRSPGDAGFPPRPDWSASRNLERAQLHWPAPERFSVLGLETLGYKTEVVLPMTVTRADPARGLELSGIVRYLTCKDICIPYEAKLALAVPEGPVRPSPFAHLIDRFQAVVPGDGSRHGIVIEGAETKRRGPDTLLTVTASAAVPFRAPDLYPEGPEVLAYSRPEVALSDGGRRAALTVQVFGVKHLGDPPAGTLSGRTLTLTLVDGMRAAEARLTVAGPGGGGTGGVPAIVVILAFAVLGGLILNLMPCVLPVLSIKLLGVVGHGGGEGRTVRLSFLASAAGILFAFLLLAGALVALKAGGMTIGWGIQFQQPWFLIAMTLVVIAFASNLWGLFEVRLPLWLADMGVHAGRAHGLGGHFLQGAFATLLATPCSAPFLGTAVGFALARGAPEIFQVFAALGLGLALPYLAVAGFPALATRLPRPGPWMATLRRVLGLALAATAVWLVSVLWASAGGQAAAALAVLAALVPAVLYLGRRLPAAGGRMVAGATLAVAAAAVAVPLVLAGRPDGARGLARGTEALDALWTKFDEAAIPGLVAAGKTVFVDVTADWCITCQVNKGLVLARGRALAALGEPGVVAMQADWTRPDAKIADYLARHMRYGIPFNAVYGPRTPKGVVLPELLSEDAVLQAFAEAGRGAKIAAREVPAGAGGGDDKGGRP